MQLDPSYCLGRYTLKDFKAAVTPAEKHASSYTLSASVFASRWKFLNITDDYPGLMGVWSPSGLAGATVVTVSKRQPRLSTMDLLFTFVAHRRRGVGAALVKWALQYAFEIGSLYFRVASKFNSVEFYRSLGFRFWGFQKSGGSLSFFRFSPVSWQPSEADYDLSDPFIYRNVFTKHVGGVVNFTGAI
jgi:GNAT superfamily N-acetyltransferase